MVASQHLSIICDDGRGGLPDKAPFDAIHVGASAETVPRECMRLASHVGRVPTPLNHVGFSAIPIPLESPLAPVQPFHMRYATLGARLAEVLVDQLRPGGRLVVPVGGDLWSQALTVVDKHEDGTSEELANSVAVQPSPNAAGRHSLRPSQSRRGRP